MKSPVSARQTPARPYDSPLRDRQSEQTRELILQALVEQLADRGLSDFNIPRVAQRAGVSVRTVYRYFPTKERLLQAAQEWIDERVIAFEYPRSAEELVALPKQVFPAFDENAPMIYAQIETELGRAVRSVGRRKRIAAYRRALKNVTNRLEPPGAEAAVALVAHLFSSQTWKSFREEFCLTGDQSGTAVAWALGTLIEDLRRRNREAT